MHTPCPWSNGNGVTNKGMASFSQGARKGSTAAGGQPLGGGQSVPPKVSSQGWAEWVTTRPPP